MVADLDRLEPAWNALREHYAAVAPELGAVRSREESWARRRAQYRSWLRDPKAGVVIAERDGKVLGYAMARPLSASATWVSGARVAELESLSVLGPYRACGIGTTLLNTVRQRLAARDITKLHARVVPGSPDTDRFFERHGFGPEGRWLATSLPKSRKFVVYEPAFQNEPLWFSRDEVPGVLQQWLRGNRGGQPVGRAIANAEDPLHAGLGLSVIRSRRALNLNQARYAAQAGIGKDTISAVERCLIVPSITLVSALAGGLGLAASQLLERAETYAHHLTETNAWFDERRALMPARSPARPQLAQGDRADVTAAFIRARFKDASRGG